MVTLKLPATPPELKSIAPYLQRANELKTQEPIVAYWCAYYAAQLGIGVKTKDPVARKFLFELLEALETIKKEIGPNDVIDDEVASSAYVESFALKVFNSADNEDRKGLATRGTAKKFLAAANFLEILSTFGSANATDGVSESTNADKIRYAKWKAADIAKAFREGRKPTPGPAGGLEEETIASPEIEVDPAVVVSDSTTSPPPPHLNLPSTPSTFDPVSPSMPPSLNSAYLGPDALHANLDPKTPQSWSTVATPGTPGISRFDPDDIVAEGNSTPPARRAWVSGEMEGRNSDSEPEEDSLLSRPGTVQTASYSTGTSMSTNEGNSLGTTPATSTETEGDPFEVTVIPPPVPSAPPIDRLPPGFVPSPPTQFSPPPPPAPTVSRQVPQQPSPVLPPPPVVAVAPVVLTPSLVAKTQRHCKFAISALDYEDAETAKKELRAALALLGG
ncbi:Vta1 like-domain-containing protein [Cristinia sonorae]|uniref:Vta1 like-domain-containing protein n=1 Tax=Cristinia sonorae TaxID=1940300 RepID=A0A8K0XRL2_9AGAR|nr:Vta1 like-domain-containing protein [Cristinia sonorae]